MHRKTKRDKAAQKTRGLVQRDKGPGRLKKWDRLSRRQRGRRLNALLLSTLHHPGKKVGTARYRRGTVSRIVGWVSKEKNKVPRGVNVDNPPLTGEPSGRRGARRTGTYKQQNKEGRERTPMRRGTRSRQAFALN